VTFDELANPYALLLALLVPPYVYWLTRTRRTAAVRYPSVRNLKRLPRSLRQRCRVLIPVLRGLAILALVIVMARPLRQLETEELPSEGIAILMLIDRSSSMNDPNNKLMHDGKLQLRFDVAKKVAQEFISGNAETLKGRTTDLIGVTSFASYPEANYPFTLYHASLVDGLGRMAPMEPAIDEYGRQVSLDQYQRDVRRNRRRRNLYRENPLDGTELRSAVEYGANQLISLGDDLSRPGDGVRKYNLRSKVMVLLTDGMADHNFSDAELINKLKEEQIKVYVVQILSGDRFRERPDGTIEVVVPEQQRRRDDIFSMFGSSSIAQMQAARQEAGLNEAIKRAKRLSTETGGGHFLATTGDKLEAIYAKIDELERVDVGARTVFSREERYRPYLFAALALLLGETVLGLTWLRRVP